MNTASQYDANARVSELIARYSDPHACAATLLCDRHEPTATAWTVVTPDLASVTMTYADLRRDSERFAAALVALGVGQGDCVATLMGKSREYLVTLLGIWRLGAVHVPLFTAFAPSAIAARVLGSAAKVLVSDGNQLPKLASSEEFPDD